MLTVISFPLMAQTLNIKIENIRDSVGTIYLAFFKDDKSYQVEQPFMMKKFSKQSVENKSLSVTVSIAEGLYAIALLDDENNDARMEYNWLGIPREGFGFSDFYARGFKRPVFSDFDFIVASPKKDILIVIRYIL